jgi:hypothetical protein
MGQSIAAETAGNQEPPPQPPSLPPDPFLSDFVGPETGAAGFSFEVGISLHRFLLFARIALKGIPLFPHFSRANQFSLGCGLGWVNLGPLLVSLLIPAWRVSISVFWGTSEGLSVGFDASIITCIMDAVAQPRAIMLAYLWA